MFVDGKYISPDTWYDGDGKPFQPQVHYFVGGATKLYGAALYRLRPGDFGDSGTSTGSLRPGRCPTTTSSRGTPGPSACTRCTATAARTRPRARSEPYPWPRFHEPRIQQIHDGLARAAPPFHAPCGILLDEADRPRSACIRCAWCDGYPCLVHAKSDAEVIAAGPRSAGERHPGHRRRGDKAGDWQLRRPAVAARLPPGSRRHARRPLRASPVASAAHRGLPRHP